ncbi:MAG: hypothetical protein ACD_80C00101G0001 [uncultured bacterium (gcode 4)]|uniref:Uncharacterized protein n=1 Tax=uncultured bacterium (gcode 4) TaxID=1234023 RepID=K1X504_9BACT|nr:MAG: hypothetical protein ACD_80C00101G0001 [uncultured bacterium (gcode 4)]
MSLWNKSVCSNEACMFGKSALALLYIDFIFLVSMFAKSFSSSCLLSLIRLFRIRNPPSLVEISFIFDFIFVSPSNSLLKFLLEWKLFFWSCRFWTILLTTTRDCSICDNTPVSLNLLWSFSSIFFLCCSTAFLLASPISIPSQNK